MVRFELKINEFEKPIYRILNMETLLNIHLIDAV